MLPRSSIGHHRPDVAQPRVLAGDRHHLGQADAHGGGTADLQGGAGGEAEARAQALALGVRDEDDVRLGLELGAGVPVPLAGRPLERLRHPALVDRREIDVVRVGVASAGLEDVARVGAVPFVHGFGGERSRRSGQVVEKRITRAGWRRQTRGSLAVTSPTASPSARGGRPRGSRAGGGSSRGTSRRRRARRRAAGGRRR